MNASGMLKSLLNCVHIATNGYPVFVTEQLKATVATAKETKEKASKKVAELENKLLNAKAVREQELNEAEKHMNTAKKSVDTSGKKLREQQQVWLVVQWLINSAGNIVVTCIKLVCY